MTTPLRTFPDPQKPKAFYIKRVRQHRAADELIRGTGWNGHRGCAIGCTLECYEPRLYPALLGIPTVIAHLEDWLFENLPEGHLDWPEQFLDAIPENADLSGVFSAWCVRLLDRCLDRVGDGEEPWRNQVRKAIQDVRNLHATNTTKHAPELVTAAAWAAAAAEAEAAGEAGAAAARAAEAEAAAEAAAWAAWAAARAAGAAGAATRAAEVQQQAKDLLELLAAAPSST
jgi:hypothetical protein